MCLSLWHARQSQHSKRTSCIAMCEHLISTASLLSAWVCVDIISRHGMRTHTHTSVWCRSTNNTVKSCPSSSQRCCPEPYLKWSFGSCISLRLRLCVDVCVCVYIWVSHLNQFIYLCVCVPIFKWLISFPRVYLCTQHPPQRTARSVLCQAGQIPGTD